MALEGNLPSFLTFGKNFAQTAPVTDYELTTTNGSQNARGYRMPVPGLITHLTCQCDSTVTGSTNSLVLKIWKNGVEQVQYGLTLNNVSSGDIGSVAEFDPPLSFNANDQITLMLTMTRGNGEAFSMDDLACLIRILN